MDFPRNVKISKIEIGQSKNGANLLVVDRSIGSPGPKQFFWVAALGSVEIFEVPRKFLANLGKNFAEKFNTQ